MGSDLSSPVHTAPCVGVGSDLSSPVHTAPCVSCVQLHRFLLYCGSILSYVFHVLQVAISCALNLINSPRRPLNMLQLESLMRLYRD